MSSFSKFHFPFPPSESLQGFQRSPLLGSQLPLISPFCSPKNPVISPKILRFPPPPPPPPQVINKDRSLRFVFLLEENLRLRDPKQTLTLSHCNKKGIRTCRNVKVNNIINVISVNAITIERIYIKIRLTATIDCFKTYMLSALVKLPNSCWRRFLTKCRVTNLLFLEESPPPHVLST